MKLMSLLSLSLLAMPVVGFSQQPSRELIHIWPGEVPGEAAAKKPIITKKQDGIFVGSEVTDPVLEVFPLPGAAVAKSPAVIIFPGGGYQILALDLEGYEIAKMFNSFGYTAFVLQYRIPNKRPGSLQDAQRALKVVKSNAAKYHIDTASVGVMGFSAGGSLAARLSTRYEDQLYPAQDGADKLSAKPAFTALIYPAYLDEGPGHTLTAELKIQTGKTPPMFIFQTSDDPYGNSSLVMASALRFQKVPAELHLMPFGGHGYGIRPGKDAATVWPRLLQHWLDYTRNH